MFLAGAFAVGGLLLRLALDDVSAFGYVALVAAFVVAPVAFLVVACACVASIFDSVSAGPCLQLLPLLLQLDLLRLSLLLLLLPPLILF